MALAETAELVAELNLRGDFPRQAQRMQGSLRTLNARTSDLRKNLHRAGEGLKKSFKAGVGIAAGAVGFLAWNIKQGLDSLAELEDVTNATRRVIESTGGVAKVTAKEVRALAERYEDLTAVDDKVIQGAENLLLTFTGVRRKAFEPALATALDMSEALGMDLNGAVRTLGRVLQAPADNLSRLTRLGVTFTDKEKEKIETLQESGRKLEAQRLILGKLNRLYGGRARTAAQGYRGSMNKLKDAVEGLQQSLARPLIRPLTRVANKLARFANTQKVQDGIRGIGEAFASLFEGPKTVVPDALGPGIAAVVRQSPMDTLFQKVQEGFQAIRDLPWDTIKQGLSTTLEVGREALRIFQGLPKEVQAGLITLLAANKVTGGALGALGKTALDLALKAVTTIMAGNVTVIGKTVTGPGTTPPPVPPKAPGGVTIPLVGAVAYPGTTQELYDRTREAFLKGWWQSLNSSRSGSLGFILGNTEGPGAKGTAAPPTVALAPVSNDILDAIAADTQASSSTLAASGARLNALNALALVGNSTTARMAADAARTAALAPVSNDILDSIAGGTTTIAQTGRESKDVFASFESETAKWLPAMVAKVGQVKTSLDRKDLNVSVAVRSTVTATTVAQGVSRVTNQNRVVID